jgi:hypothetical protein
MKRLRARDVVLCFAVGLAVVAGLSGTRQAWALTNDEVKAQIEEVLMERHPSDTPDWWRSLGSNTPGVIISMYERTSYTYKRVRLLQGLAWFDVPEAVEFLKRQAESTEDSVIRNVSIRSIGFSQGKKETDFIAKFLNSQDPQTRYAAADTLQKLNDPHASEVLEKYLKQEKTPWIAPKLKGELPKPALPLTPVGSSEDRLAPEFAGEWSGFWIVPKGAGEKGMESLPVAFQLKNQEQGADKPGAQPIGAVGGELMIQEKTTAEKLPKKKEAPRVFKFDRVAGKGTHITGVLMLLPVR